MKFRNWLLFICAVSLWGTNWAVMKIGVSLVPPTTFVLHRFVLSSIVLSPIPVLLRKRIPKDRYTLGKLILLCLINVSSVALTHVGLVQESSGIGAVLTYTQPLFVFCLAIPFLKEKISSVRLLGGAMGFVGVIILFRGRITSFALSSALIMILGAFLWSVVIIYYKKYLSHVDPLVTNFFQFSIGVLPLAMLSLMTTGFIFPGDAAYTWIILYASIGASAIAFTIWFLLLKEEEATALAGSTFIVPIVAMLFGWQLLGESFYIESILGSVLIVAGVYLVNLKNR